MNYRKAFRNLLEALGEKPSQAKIEAKSNDYCYVDVKFDGLYLVCENEEVANELAKKEAINRLRRNGFDSFPPSFEKWAIENATTGYVERKGYDFDEDMVAEEAVKRFGRTYFLATDIKSRRLPQEIPLDDGMIAYKMEWHL